MTKRKVSHATKLGRRQKIALFAGSATALVVASIAIACTFAGGPPPTWLHPPHNPYGELGDPSTIDWMTADVYSTPEEWKAYGGPAALESRVHFRVWPEDFARIRSGLPSFDKEWEKGLQEGAFFKGPGWSGTLEVHYKDGKTGLVKFDLSYKTRRLSIDRAMDEAYRHSLQH